MDAWWDSSTALGVRGQRSEVRGQRSEVRRQTSKVRGHLGLGVELRVEEAAEDVLAQARAAVQRPRGVVTLRVHLVLGMEAGWWLVAWSDQVPGW